VTGTSLLVPVVVASLAGSVHCAGMCGGLVAFAVGDAGTSRAERGRTQLAYHLTRGAGYVALGAAFGLLGRAVDGAGLQLGVGRVAGVIAGATMLLWGGAKLLAAAGMTLAIPVGGAPMARRLAGLVRWVREKPPVLRGAVVGSCTAALPCGWLHAFSVVAAGTASPLDGALVMAAFFAGTVPALAGIGLGVQALRGRLRSQASLVFALALVVVGLWSVLGRLSIPAESLRSQTNPLVADGKPPCHAH
jgi:sulfite exporter TauE/SafE